MDHRKTYFKALILLLVFSMNTVVSFACSFSSMFHAIHHHEHASALTYEHKNGTHHGNEHVHGPLEHHNSNEHTTKREGDNQKEDCCSTSVWKMEAVVKLTARSIDAPEPIILLSLLSDYFSYFSVSPLLEPPAYDDFLRRRIPATIENLRIVIQSFQI